MTGKQKAVTQQHRKRRVNYSFVKLLTDFFTYPLSFLFLEL